MADTRYTNGNDCYIAARNRYHERISVGWGNVRLRFEISSGFFSWRVYWSNQSDGYWCNTPDDPLYPGTIKEQYYDIDDDGNWLGEDGLVYDPDDPSKIVESATDGELAFNELKTENNLTDDELKAILALIAAGVVTAFIPGVSLPLLGKAALIGTALIMAGCENDMPLITREEYIKDYYKENGEYPIWYENPSPEVKLEESLLVDMDSIREEYKQIKPYYPVDESFLRDQAAYYGGELADKSSDSYAAKKATAENLSDWLYNNYWQSSIDVPVGDTVQKYLDSDLFIENMRSNYISDPPADSRASDLIGYQIDKTQTSGELMDRYFSVTDGSATTELKNVVEKNKNVGKDVQNGESVNSGNTIIKKSGGSVSITINNTVDLTPVVNALTEIKISIDEKELPSTVQQERQAANFLFNEYGLDMDGENVKEGYRFKEGKLADNRNEVEFDDTVIKQHTTTSGEIVDIKKGYKQNIVASKQAEKNLEQHYREEGKNESDIILSQDDNLNNIPVDEKLIEKLVFQDGEISDKDLFFLKYINALRLAQGLPEIQFDETKINAIADSVIVDLSLMNGDS